MAIIPWIYPHGKTVERRRRKAIGTVECQPAANEDSVQMDGTEFLCLRRDSNGKQDAKS